MSCRHTSSTLISLAWAGQLEFLSHAPIPLIIPEEVRQEAIKAIPSPAPESHRPAASQSVDEAVLEAGRRHGVLATNDLALGRRAANLGVHWLRTADLVLLCVRTSTVSKDRGIAALRALRSAGRITDDLLNAFLEDLP